jgi:hypothetical protein
MRSAVHDGGFSSLALKRGVVRTSVHDVRLDLLRIGRFYVYDVYLMHAMAQSVEALRY